MMIKIPNGYKFGIIIDIVFVILSATIAQNLAHNFKQSKYKIS